MAKSFQINRRLVFALVVLALVAGRVVAQQMGLATLGPGLHLYAYVSNVPDGTVSVVDLVALAPRGQIAVGPAPSGLRAHPTRPELWGVSTTGGYVWVIDARTGTVAA
ncbi:MAG TPA: hypothetical protein VKG84_14005, partial [Candidatus Acidoferrales bacterium]|nr:hypothetical protein [Candidatus Acidoferrales bacterium]